MVEALADRLEAYFLEETSDSLRSIIAYEPESHHVQFLRDDVASQYSPQEFDQSIRETRFDSFTKPMYEATFSGEHGDLTCLVQAFEDVVEMNFVLEDWRGVAVGLDADALEETNGLVAGARTILIERSQQEDP